MMSSIRQVRLLSEVSTRSIAIDSQRRSSPYQDRVANDKGDKGLPGTRKSSMVYTVQVRHTFKSIHHHIYVKSINQLRTASNIAGNLWNLRKSSTSCFPTLILSSGSQTTGTGMIISVGYIVRNWYLVMSDPSPVRRESGGSSCRFLWMSGCARLAR
jgi:hypothetical protein